MHPITQSPMPENQKPHPRTHRKPLKPKNSESQSAGDDNAKSRVRKTKKKQRWIEISLVGLDDRNKENHRPISPFDASLGEELSAIRKKIERMRLEKEKTERVLRERDLVLEKAMRGIEENEKAQRRLEMEVELLLRLKELRCFRTASLREIEREKKIKDAEQLLMEEDKSNTEERVAERSVTSDSIN